MRKSVFFLFFMTTSPIVFAEEYKVVMLNSTEIRIAGKSVEKGSIIQGNDTIYWPNDMAAMRVVRKSDYNTFDITAAGFRRCQNSTIEDNRSRRKLSARGEKDDVEFVDTLYLIDTVRINAGYYYTNQTSAFLRLKGENDKKDIMLLMDAQRNHYPITREMLGDNGNFRVDIIQVDREFPEGYVLYKDLIIKILPKWL